jgi:hypothetical protein
MRRIWQTLVPIFIATIFGLLIGSRPLQAAVLSPPAPTVPAPMPTVTAPTVKMQVLPPALPMRTATVGISTPSNAPTTANAPKPDPDYLQGVASMRRQAESEPNSPTNQALKDVLQQLFNPPAVQIPFRFVTDKAGVKVTNYAGDIYFSQGAIFINYNESNNDDHFATIDNKLYTWKTGKPEGETLKRFPGDTLAFVMYMIDPAAIMRSIYVQYLDEPQKFTVKPGMNGEKSILFKQVKNGFKGIRVQSKPFWLKGFLLAAAPEKGGQTGSLEIDAPIALAAIPQTLLTLPQGVTFKPSQETLRNRMTYL